MPHGIIFPGLESWLHDPDLISPPLFFYPKNFETKNPAWVGAFMKRFPGR
jgi:hypothetical protein